MITVGIIHTLTDTARTGDITIFGATGLGIIRITEVVFRGDFR